MSSIDTYIYGAGMPDDPAQPDLCPSGEGGQLNGGTLEIVAVDSDSVQLTITGTTFSPDFFQQPDVNGDYTAARCPTPN